ncbi:hypothetical protein NBRC3257_0863 [Gluconobacter thailandicus NBRC 3257]|uniref:Uncharacterized protein n=1 Tax=Gluconobacter thailandicus NBRC 3257 TaxID=1381097 RepID=A0ABQ0IUJ0_GLUTH|nr:hypothetical protein NBRC3255_1927 [Gluconobacter thailandicus NBRC 3255]GAD25864.1 hypothetical protein NBRC3257_0863 [Gluconobacter thailandicus NBRC 3257]
MSIAHPPLAVRPVYSRTFADFGFLMAQRLTGCVGTGITDKLSPLAEALSALLV